MKWLKDLISPIDVAYSDRQTPKSIARFNTDAKIKQAFTHRANCRNALDSQTLNSWRYRLDRWDAKRFRIHTSGDGNYFYASSHAGSGLLCIDVDCHDGGDPDDAMACLRWLAEERFPGMHYERSTSGSGGHGYLIVDYDGMKADQVREAWRDKVGPWLDEIVKTEGFDVDLVEVCGTPTNLEFARNGNVSRVRFGQLAKLPRDMQACESTTRLTMSDLTAMMPDSTVAKPTRRLATAEKQNGEAKAKPKKRGSIQGSYIQREMIDDMLPLAHWVIRTADTQTQCAKRLSVVAEDVAMTLVLAKLFDRQANSDGSMPVARFRALWQQCHEDGMTTRQYHGSRLSVIRYALADLGILRIDDARYAVPSLAIARTDNGHTSQRGIAAKWSVDATQLMICKALATNGGIDLDLADSPPSSQSESIRTEGMQHRGNLEFTSFRSSRLEEPKRLRRVQMRDMLRREVPSVDVIHLASSA